MRIFIDGDGSPVKKEVYQLAKVHNRSVVVVSSYAHYTKEVPMDHVERVYVDPGADAADFRIVSLLSSGDVLVTQDYGLASLALPKGVRVLSQLGFEYTSDNIDELLMTRFLSAQVRRSGGRTKGPKPYSHADRERFIHTLTQILTL